MHQVTKESSLYQRFASGGQDSIKAGIELVRSYGFGVPQSRQELVYMLAECVVKDEEALKKIALYHPDKDFIIDNVAQVEILAPTKKPVRTGTGGHNDCGCAGSHNDTGSVGLTIPAPGTSKKTFEVQDMVVLFGLSIFGLGILFSFALLIKAFTPTNK